MRYGVAENVKAVVMTMKVMSLVCLLLSRSRIEKQVAYAWFKTFYMTLHPGFFENPGGMVFFEVIDPCREISLEVWKRFECVFGVHSHWR